MMRVCHLDTCPVGVATQNPELRKRFTGKPEFVVNFFEFIAEEVRELLAALGFRIDRRGDRPRRGARHARRRSTTGRRAGLDLSPILCTCRRPVRPRRSHCVDAQDHGLDQALDNAADRAVRGRRSSAASRCSSTLADPQRQPHRRHDARHRGHPALRRRRACPTARSTSRFTGSAGQSFGAFVPRGHHAAPRGRRQRLPRQGPVGRPHRRPPGRDASRSSPRRTSSPATSSLYGATGGEVFLRGVVGERFCVRNSGATAVVEGVGDHGCEYMTGGRVVVLGPTGRNFGAGMSRRHRLRATTPTARSRARQPRDGRPRAARRRRRGPCCGVLERRHLDQTGSTVAAAPARRLGNVVGPVRQGHAPRLQARCCEARCARRWTPGSREDSQQPLDAIMEALAMGDRQRVPRRRGARAADAAARAGAAPDWKEVYEPFPAPTAAQRRPRAAWTAASRSATTAARSGNLIPDWNDLVVPRPLARRRSSACTPPTTSPSSPGGSARRRARRRACSASTPTRSPSSRSRSIIDRAWDEGWVAPQPPERADRQDGRRRRLRAGRPRRRAAADPRRPRRRRARAGRPHRRAAALRHPRVQDGEAPPRPAPRADGGRGHRVPTERRTSATTVAVDELLRRVRRRRARRRRDRVARPAGPRPRADGHPPGDGVPAARRTACSRATSTSRRSRAAGKHVVIIGGGDTGADCLGTAHRQGAASVHQFEILPRPPDDRAAGATRGRPGR